MISSFGWRPAGGAGAGWALLPLGFNVGYTLATAVGRFSGWRYDLPADWVPYFYFAVGFVELLGSGGGLVRGAPSARNTS